MRNGILAAFILALASAPALAQPQPPAPAAIDAAQRKAVVDAAAAAMRDRYVFPELGARAAARLQGALAAGEYDALTTPAALAQRLTADLNALAPDGHLRVNLTAAARAAAPATAPPTVAANAEAGVVRADRLPGGVAYIELNYFADLAALGPSLTRIMPQLADARALIIDLRRNTGGNSNSPAYLVSFLTEPGKRIPLYDMHSRQPGQAQTRTISMSSVPTPVSFHGKPVFVLTSRRTISAAEAFAYTAQALKLVTVVGETTAGAANGGGSINLSPQLSLYLPTFQPIIPATGKNWEGVGVVPDLKVPQADALKAALERLGQSPVSGDIAALSTAKVFEPRSVRQPGTEAALRRMIAEISRGEPDYGQMSLALAQTTRNALPAMKQRFEQLGALQEVRFLRMADGRDIYRLQFANGAMEYGLVLEDDGKVRSAIMRDVPP